MSIIIFYCITTFCVLVVAAYPPPKWQYPSPPRNDAKILSYYSRNIGNGNYEYGYHLSDGTKREERGHLENAGGPEPSISVAGSYSYVNPDGKVVQQIYKADTNGFQPQPTRSPSVVVNTPPKRLFSPLNVANKLLG